MTSYRSAGRFFGGMGCIALLAIFLAGCGTGTSTTTGSTTSTTPTTAAVATTNCIAQATGTIQSLSGTTLNVNDMQGKAIQLTYTSTTVFTRETTTTSTSVLQEGKTVQVRVTQNADGSYSAQQILLTSGVGLGTGFGTGVRRQATPGAQTVAICGRKATGTGGRNGQGNGNFPGNGTGTATATGARSISGTVGQMTGNNLIVTDRNGSDYTIGIVASTQIVTIATVSSSALKSGEPISASGIRNSQGVISARQIIILQSLPKRTTGQ